MIVLQGSDVNDLYPRGIKLLLESGARQSSRAGDVISMQVPVTSVYINPTNRVLFDERRDANPFFHLMEAIWMLSGSDDASWLDQFVHDFSSRFSEDDGHQWGAYGHRWRNHYDIDQLDIVVRRLRKNNDDRRVVIAMWDADMDLWDPDEIDDSTGKVFVEPRDLPCNTHIYPRVVNGRLDITICCRSNDAVWGAYGANAVHFSVLQEYLAAGIGIPVGKMYQVSNNLHIYTSVLKKVTGLPDGSDTHDAVSIPVSYVTPYKHDVSALPMIEKYDSFAREAEAFISNHSTKTRGICKYENKWFVGVAAPMYHASQLWRTNREEAVDTLQHVRASDWREAALAWVNRRTGGSKNA